MPTPNNHSPGTDREVPREVRYFTNGLVFRKLTLKERLLVLLGYNLALECHIATEHKPGKTVPLVSPRFIPVTTLEGAKELIRVEAEAKKKADDARASKATKTFTPPPLKLVDLQQPPKQEKK